MPLSQQEIIDLQYGLGPKIKTVFENFIAKPVEEQTKGKAQVEIQRLEEYFNTSNGNHTALLQLRTLNREHEYFTAAFLQRVEDDYYWNKGKLNEFIIQHDLSHSSLNFSANRDVAPVGAFSAAPVVSCRNFPPIKLPEFSGKPMELETFRDLWTTIVDDTGAQLGD